MLLLLLDAFSILFSQPNFEINAGQSLGSVMAIGISALFSSFIIFLVQEKQSKVM